MQTTLGTHHAGGCEWYARTDCFCMPDEPSLPCTCVFVGLESVKGHKTTTVTGVQNYADMLAILKRDLGVGGWLAKTRSDIDFEIAGWKQHEVADALVRHGVAGDRIALLRGG